MTTKYSTPQAIRDIGISPNVCDSNLEPANLVDVGYFIAKAGHHIANAITPQAAPGRDAAGGNVQSLTESVMGITGGLHAVADAINRLASAVECRNGGTEDVE